jgi:putative DNA primase/helicase
MVTIFCIDLDDHADDGGNVHLLDALRRFFGADPIVFSSKGGKGLHCFFILAVPMPVDEFIVWSKSWGFNREGQPELFPKTKKLTQAWLPNSPNDKGGDTYRSGTFDSCVVEHLHPAPARRLSAETQAFLRGGCRERHRNTALNKAAYELGKHGYPRDEAWRLCEIGATVCGLAAEEPEKTAATFESGFESGRRQVGSSVNVTSNDDERLSLWSNVARTDAANGKRFTKRFGGVIRWCEAWETWLVFDGKRWRIDDLLAAEALFKQVADDLWEEAVAIARDSDDKHLITAVTSFVKATNSANGIRNAMALARSEPGIAVVPSIFDTDGFLFNCVNGTLDLRTGQLRPHDKSDMLTKLCPTPFDPEVDCALWREVLRTIMAEKPEMVRFLQRCFGMSLSGVVREHVLLIVYGTGSNGKSLFINTAMDVLGTDYAMKAPMDLLVVKKNDAHPTERADLFGKRMVACIESEDGGRLAEALVKELTGGDSIRARRMRENFFEFKPSHHVWMSTNHRLIVRGTDHGIWRRLRMLPFTVTIADEDQDAALPEKLRAEFSGILNWAVLGCLDWQHQGLLEPPDVMTATEGYRSEMDIVGRFLADRCILGPQHEAHSADLIVAFEAWCKDTGDSFIGPKRFGTKLTERGIGSRRSTGGKTVRTGVGLLRE